MSDKHTAITKPDIPVTAAPTLQFFYQLLKFIDDRSEQLNVAVAIDSQTADEHAISVSLQITRKD